MKLKISLVINVFILALFSLCSMYITFDVYSLSLFLIGNLIVLFYFLLKFSKVKYVFPLMIPFLFSQVTVLISTFYLDYGKYMPEIKSYSTLGASTSRLVFFISVFLFSSILGFHLARIIRFKNIAIQMGFRFYSFEKQINIFFYIVIVLLLLGGVIWNVPIFLNISRLSYWNNHPFNLLKSIYSLLPFLALCLGCLYAEDMQSKRRVIIKFSVIIIINILYGEKFSGLIWCTIYFFVGYILIKQLKGESWIGKKSYRIGLLGIATVMLLYLLIFIHYRYIHLVEGSVNEFILGRILGMQGQVWNSIDEIVINSGYNTNISAILDKSTCENYTGLFYLMSQIADSEQVNRYCFDGVRFTMGYPAILLTNFGYLLGQVINAFFGFFVGVVIFFISSVFKKLNIIKLLVSFKLLVFMSESYNMGEMYVIFSLKFLLAFATLIFLSLFALKNEKYSWGNNA